MKSIANVTAISVVGAKLRVRIGAMGKAWVPVSEIHATSAVRVPGDIGVLVVSDRCAREMGVG